MLSEKSTLKYLDEFYKKYKTGCDNLEDLVEKETLDFLMKKDFIFKTKEGYFLSIFGEDELANIS